MGLYKSPGKISLTPKQEEKKERWLLLFALHTKFHSRLQAIKTYIAILKDCVLKGSVWRY